MRFADPYLLALLLLIPLLLFLKKRISADRTAGGFSDVSLLAAYQPTWRLRFRWLPTAIRALALVLLVVALARPQGSRAETDIPVEGIDIALVLDVSSSMDARFGSTADVNRLSAAKQVITDFVSGRSEDRLGLVIFGGRSLILSPLTTDYEALSTLVQTGNVRLVTDGTTIGNGLAQGIDLLRDSRARSRVAILLTDGQNGGGEIEPLQAAQIAQTLGIHVHTIGLIESNGSTANLDKDLEAMAKMTGGRYFSADDTNALEQIYNDIDQLEKSRIEQPQFATYKELAPYLLAAALLLLALELTLRATVWRQTA